VAAQSDILSVHLALNDKTRGLVNASVLGKLKPGSFFLNTARGEVVDYAALEQAVKERGLRVALDVYAKEPSSGVADFTEPLLALPNVYGTHHIGASTDQAQEAIAAETVRIVKAFKETGHAPNVVNP
jgi:D-3-phosphoglycerate dehydrogenase / 2-oxoglutarate reductase